MAVVDADVVAGERGGRARVEARVLGAFDVTVDGRHLDRADWQRVSAERLVKLLLVSQGHAVSREVAAETLWPEADPEAGRTNLRKALHFARRAIGVPDVLSGDGSFVRLDRALVELDLDRLRAALDVLGTPPAPVGSSRRRPPGARPEGDDGAAGRSEAVTIVLELGARTLLPDDGYEDWLVTIREQLQSRWLLVAMDAAHEAAAEGRRADAHAIVEQVLDGDSTDEAAHRLAIELYAAEGRHHAARRQFELCRRALADGLDATPSPETEAAYRRAEQTASASGGPAQSRSRLVARQRELERIEPLLDRVAAGRQAALVIRGPAGIGKTRLLDEVRDYARGCGWREIAWQALESTHPVAFAPFALRLRDEMTTAGLESWDEPERSALATILPGLGVPPRLPFADRSALLVALVGALGRLARERPRLIAIDDLPWLDGASVELLGSVAAALSSEPILIAVTYRDEEPLPERAASLLDELRRSGALELRVGPLAERDVEPLVLGHLGGDAVAGELSAALFRYSEGNPLFCLEVARDARDRGVVQLDHGRWSVVPGKRLGSAPETARHVVATRSRALPPGAAELLGVAAELGPEVSYETLVAVLPDPERGLISGLDAALASGLLVERGAGYAFAHPLYRLAVESASGIARRAQMHLAIACALAGGDGTLDAAALPDIAARHPDPTPVAEHALLACELGLTAAAPLAVGFGFAAAKRSRVLFDRDAAATLAERSLAVWRRLPKPEASCFDASDAYAGLAELRMAEGRPAEAEVDFRAAIGAVRTDYELAIAYDRFTWLPYEHGNFEAAIALCEEALGRLPVEAVEGRAIVSQRLGWCLARLHRMDEAIARIGEAVTVLETAGDPGRLSHALDMLGTLLPFVGRWNEALPALERALAIALETHDARNELVRGHIAATLTRAGRAADARPHVERSLELADQMGEWYLEAVSAWMAAEMEDQLGNVEAARAMRLRELALLERAGGNPHNAALAHAHLAHLARLAGDAGEEARQAATARELAAADREPGYAARIAEALAVANWSDLLTG